MKENGQITSINDDVLDQAAGGACGNIPPQHFNIGDRVKLLLYPEYGIGTVMDASLVSNDWHYSVQFDAGLMSANETEFIHA